MPASGLKLAVLLLLAACQPGHLDHEMQYPLVPYIDRREAGLSCDALDDAIQKLDAVRWAMRQDGIRLQTTGERASQLAAEAHKAAPYCTVSVLLCSGMASPATGNSEKLDSADRRLLGLLELKQKRRCDTRPTGLPGVSDLALAGQVMALLAQEREPAAARPAMAILHAERTRLLDHLRP